MQKRVMIANAAKRQLLPSSVDIKHLLEAKVVV